MGNGLILVNTGDGKGKTTAALGLGLRATGHGMKVLMLQFIKGAWHTGELEAMKRLEPGFRIVQLGLGFIRKEGLPGTPYTDEIIENAKVSWDYAKQEIFSDLYDVVILDEINNMTSYGLLDAEDILAALKERPKRLHVILTGRNAHSKIIELADIVTEMHDIKHCYKKGIKAQKGIEF
ncbi:MAG: cob(I)yrinic acid a,c-diamide adenosyltransferase [Candidatus Jettenia sp.]|uniref:corrinoid adenosyltransferase n=1 Tax=Candidatus Jettenia caeni TaxID=247490 RepID=I3IPQ6_9BACT|nr:cob(I)yrinic acid a,c-diamide adenosyltransferase [Candidatus Jettenia sp. AMX1]MBC6929159.1 cob(I)yrinic acid a,c-diamide adenosyltransferase [Candidatus Jettenia sp.]NUN24776.1 cob(I)yrinic acid a,c-diamide adenosyltransferase [Candidatus Jettenia caeni]KAA0250218.1 MAG: cob(I)yrinic acid a,c-diamide adenosyltransferase [Candidatus Jettenia sp. AMX1]MCE7880514.1 cob(I)yrinic acid a,c-diamide adenosyltransferase [Candidatus Jettenia sp. AMX1]MCQ3927315.1 cob(I)yrinic acid a,c-diamide adeno